jgi:hypothetical protein
MTDRFGPVDVSLTTISTRLPTLAGTLRSLMDQDHDALRVHLWISEEPHLLDAGIRRLPAEIAALEAGSGGRLCIERCPNWGPYRKLVPYLRRHWGASRLVVTADDDTIYPRDWLAGLLAAWETYGCCVAYRGHRMGVVRGEVAPYRSWMRAPIEENPSRLLLPTGKDGVLYDTAFFEEGVLDMETALRIAPTVDDLWFRWHLAARGVPVHLISTDYATGSLAGAETDAADSLYLRYNLQGGNDAAIAALEAHFRARTGTGLADRETV